MIVTPQLLSEINATIGSGYYERKAPARREKRSLAETIEKMHAGGRLPIILEMKCADPRSGQCFSSRALAQAALAGLGGFAMAAKSAWVEPKFHAGDLGWLALDEKCPVLMKDYVISEKQLVGGDAALLSMPLLAAAGIDAHFLIEAAHDNDIEVVLEAYTQAEFDAAGKTEADILAINNFGPNGSPATIETTLSMLSESRTGRPVISSEGITEPSHIRALLAGGVGAVEVGPAVWAKPDGRARLDNLAKAVSGKSPA